jgi:hypothetical protein
MLYSNLLKLNLLVFSELYFFYVLKKLIYFTITKSTDSLNEKTHPIAAISIL